ncbi:MAG: phage tail sheath family protein [Clostridiales bacterium]|nr:phage tail sheath family protein [Clostridiales bacterium]
MAFGGGTWITQNKVLPGAYINFISAEKANANISDRGYAAMPLELDWGPELEVITVTSEDFIKNSLKIFGHAYTDDEMLKVREIFCHATTLYTVKLNIDGTKASCDYGTAKYAGIAGNDICIVISADDESGETFTVKVLMNGTTVFEQSGASSTADLEENDYIDWSADGDQAVELYSSESSTGIELDETAGTYLTGGTNGTTTANSHQMALGYLESFSFNTLGCDSDDETVKKLYYEYTKRLRDECGVKFQCVLYNYPADYEGVINETTTLELVYWVTGASAGCAVNASLTNTTYDGEYEFISTYGQSELSSAIKTGQFIFHSVGDDLRVLKDINSFISTTKTKNSDFSLNQVIRVLDQIGNDVAVLFNDSYNGKMPNDKLGRISLWGDVVQYCKKLETLRAIEDFEDDDVTVEEGETKTAVVIELQVDPVAAMDTLYMTVYVN